MAILGIETSCDETALSIVQGEGAFPHTSLRILSDITHTQLVHTKWGGVVPNLAKREHAAHLTRLLREALRKAHLPESKERPLSEKKEEAIRDLLSREHTLSDELITFLRGTGKPNLHAIAVTTGPGLEPALWVGINFAQALATAWDIPVIPVNHMEGHIISVLIDGNTKETKLRPISFPLIALLISGGHTELVLARDWFSYEVIGQTRDDAVGEAFDKVARILDLPYPGGPEISKMAEAADQENRDFVFTPPMIDSPDFDFSFSGLKTSVLYAVQELKTISDKDRQNIALGFEKAASSVLLSKTKRAVQEHDAKTVLIGGGVSANTRIRRDFQAAFPGPSPLLLLPEKNLSTDNALMIAATALLRSISGKSPISKELIARGNLSLAS